MDVQDGSSCLHVAAMEGQLAVAKHLAEKGGRELLMLTNKVSGGWGGGGL